MKCPFLKEAKVKSCEATAYRKMLLSESTDSGTERCSTPGYAACHAAAARLAGRPVGDRCPFLHEAQAEFCGAASVTRFIPATNDLLSHCNSDGHLYCELYLVHADPQGERRPHPAASRDGAPPGPPAVEGVLVPPSLSFAPNHMWLDVADDGCCHVGIDAFASRVLGSVDRVTFVTGGKLTRPIAVLRVNSVDVQMAFPNPLHLVAANVYLRTAPAKLTDDPYGAGWLFEAVEPVTAGAPLGGRAREGLLAGASALSWMRDETARLNDFVHQRLARPDADGMRVMADGGSFAEGPAAHLDHEELLNLVSEFFAPQVGWRRSF